MKKFSIITFDGGSMNGGKSAWLSGYETRLCIYNFSRLIFLIKGKVRESFPFPLCACATFSGHHTLNELRNCGRFPASRHAGHDSNVSPQYSFISLAFQAEGNLKFLSTLFARSWWNFYSPSKVKRKINDSDEGGTAGRRNCGIIMFLHPPWGWVRTKK